MIAKYDLIIIGAGPAGLSAGIYAGRSGLKTLILEKLEAGGQIISTERIDNYPGSKSVNSRNLIAIMKEQAEDFGVIIKNDEAISIEVRKEDFKVKASNDFEARAIIIAVGTCPKHLNLPGEDKFIGRGVSYCATCDGPFFKNKKICVIGGGNAAVEEAIYLTKYVKKVNLIHRRTELRAAKALQDKAFKNDKINIVWDTVPVEILGDNRVSGIKIKNVKTNQESLFATEGVFVFIGFVPHTQNFKELINLDENGFIITDQDMKTSRDGIFACGDCRSKPLRQVVTACSDGAVAANSALKFLEQL